MFIGITFISFLIIHLAPGGPVDARSALNPKMTLQAREKLRELYGLNKPLVTQYIEWCSRLARLDFGNSFTDGAAVTEKIAATIPVTLGINLLSLCFIFAAGIPLGIFGAVHKDTAGDKTLSVLSFAAFSVPTFWLALLLVSFFGVTLGWLPVMGLHSLFYEEMPFSERWLDLAKHLVLPLFVSSVTGLAGISRYMRSSMAQALREPYIRTARAKGLPEKTVIYRHALKNALLPVITILGLSVPGLLGGSVIFETIFSIPGMGRLFYNSVFSRDYPVIMGILVLGAVLTLLGNALADLGYAIADPRIRSGLGE